MASFASCSMTSAASAETATPSPCSRATSRSPCDAKKRTHHASSTAYTATMPQ
jgi:hypothetical protein